MIEKKIAVLILFIVLTTHTFAQWNYLPTQNTPIDTGLNKNSTNPALTTDGNGGYYAVWMKSKPGVYGQEIYAQHINAGGHKLWADTGVLICNAPVNQLWPKLIADGTGGAIIVWQDYRKGFGNSDIYAQRVTAAGALVWTINGVPVFDSFFDELGPEIISDGSGGAMIVAWRSAGGGQVTDIFAQRISAAGAKLWGEGGAVVCDAPGNQDVPKIITDGNNGAIISWWDFRNSPANNVADIYAQRLNANGMSVWANNGIPVCTSPYDQYVSQLYSDNNNGAYLVWQDFRNSTASTSIVDIFAQHINGNGVSLWAVNGISVCSAPDLQLTPSVTADNNGDAIFSWVDYRFGRSAIYAQKLSAAGNPQWAFDGIPVCANVYTGINNVYPFQVSDKNSGVYIFWQDQRTGLEQDIYAQHLNADGSVQWVTDGIPVCKAAGPQYLNYPDNQTRNGDAISDGHGNAIVIWQDNRSQAQEDIYMAKVADKPVIPIIVDIKEQCRDGGNAKGKLLNPPLAAAISITLDGIPVSYSEQDSSFLYFTGNSTPTGNHVISVKYANFAGITQKDSSYLVKEAIPLISIAGTTNVNQGQPVVLTASFSDGGNAPLLQWQDSISNGLWIDIPGAAASTITYTPIRTGNKIRCTLLSNAACASPTRVESNTISFVVNPVIVPPAAIPAIRIYPNPTSGKFFIDSLPLNESWQSVEIYSMEGRRLSMAKYSPGQAQLMLDITAAASGSYIVIVRRRHGSSIYFKLIKI